MTLPDFLATLTIAEQSGLAAAREADADSRELRYATEAMRDALLDIHTARVAYERAEEERIRSGVVRLALTASEAEALHEFLRLRGGNVNIGLAILMEPVRARLLDAMAARVALMAGEDEQPRRAAEAATEADDGL